MLNSFKRLDVLFDNIDYYNMVDGTGVREFVLGDAVTGYLYSDGTYLIEGTGDNASTYDFTSAADVPHAAFADRVTSVVITGVTCIGDYTFSGLSNLSVVTIPRELTSIGEYAFSDTALESVRVGVLCDCADSSFPEGIDITHYTDGANIIDSVGFFMTDSSGYLLSTTEEV